MLTLYIPSLWLKARSYVVRKTPELFCFPHTKNAADRKDPIYSELHGLNDPFNGLKIDRLRTTSTKMSDRTSARPRSPLSTSGTAHGHISSTWVRMWYISGGTWWRGARSTCRPCGTTSTSRWFPRPSGSKRLLKESWTRLGCTQGKGLKTSSHEIMRNRN